jgi:site-specific DNA-methyltransferase (adenine-specific)
MEYPIDYINKIIQGDCLEIMKQLPDKCIDLILTDPPYGINCAGGVGGGIAKGRKYTDTWDSKTPTQEVFNELLRVSKNAIIFGGNFFTDKLPQNNHWIVWDKVGEIKFDNPYSGAELAWTNIQKNTVKKYVVIQAGFIAQEKERYHPTQKPVSLFKGILQDYSKENELILDPFLGSGTTAIACQNLHRNFIGIEIDKKYCDISESRLRQKPLL